MQLRETFPSPSFAAFFASTRRFQARGFELALAMSRIAYTLEQLSQSLQLPLQGDPTKTVDLACSLEFPRAQALSFCEKPQQVKIQGHQVGILICPQSPPGEDWNVLISSHPRVSFAQALHLLYPQPKVQGGVHASAWVDASASIHPDAWVGPLCSVGAGTSLGEGCCLVAQVNVGANCRLGARTRLLPGVDLADGCSVGSDCVLEPGCRMLDRAQIGDRVWLGGRNVLRGCLLGSGIKTDNHVFVGPGCQIGDCVLLVGQVCVSADVRMGPYSLVAAQAMVTPGVELAAQVQVAGRATVYDSVLTPGVAVAGDPAISYATEMKNRALRSRSLAAYRAALSRAQLVADRP